MTTVSRETQCMYSIKPQYITRINKDRMGGACSTHTERNAKV